MDSQDKKTFFEYLASKGPVQVLLDLDPTENELDLPDHLWHNGSVTLNFSYKYGTPLNVGAQGIGQLLSFASHGPYQVYVPWNVISCIQGPNHEYKQWAEDGQVQGLIEADGPLLASPQSGSVQSKQQMAPAKRYMKGKLTLTVLEGGVARGEATPTPPRTGHLHLVK